MDLCKRTQQLWRIYMTAREPGALEEILEWVDPDCVVIGTGRHEFYDRLQPFVDAMGKEMAERRTVHLEIVDEWYAQRELAPDLCLVYGGLHMRDPGLGEEFFVDMDTRFSILYQVRDGLWKVVHLHLSMPNAEQEEGEYYPKTLFEQVQEARDLAERMSRLARLDSLTGLLNHRTFFEEGKRYLERGGAFWCFMLDLDDFKRVNDTLGHLAGDEVLKTIAATLRSAVRNQDLVGRVGGDEFAILCAGPQGRAEISAVAGRILRMVADKGQNYACWPGMSIGIAKVRSGEDLQEAFRRADKAMYLVKGGTKNDFALDAGE